jgi:O-antigen/teichoic acid export membrane protein
MTGLRKQSSYFIVLIAGPIVPIALSFAGLIVARSLSPSVYGRVAYFFSSFNLITILWQLGLGPLATGEVARATRTGGTVAASLVTPPYLVARLATLALLVPVGLGAALLGDWVVASAAAAAGIALLAAFAQSLAQGVGRASLVGCVQIGQALLYLGLVAVWAKDEPERVFVAVSATYALVVLPMAWASRAVVPSIRRWWTLSHGHWRAASTAVGWLYAIGLLSTPFTSLSVLVLGNVGRFVDAASFSIAFTIPLLMAVSAATIISIQYYPRLCQLLPDSSVEAQKHFDSLYRLVVWVGLSAAAILLTQPSTVISVLFTPAYAGAVGPLAALSVAALVLPVLQIGLWTLVAHRLWRWAAALAATELIGVVPWIAVAVLLPKTPLWLLGAGHTLSAAGALAVAITGLHSAKARYGWRPLRSLIAAAVAVAVAFAVHVLIGAALQESIVSLVYASAIVAFATGLILWSPELLPNVKHVNPAWRPSAATTRSGPPSRLDAE